MSSIDVQGSLHCQRSKNAPHHLQKYVTCLYNSYASVVEGEAQIRQQHESLSRQCESAIDHIEKLTEEKKQQEIQLYTNFVLVLNGKKEKIRTITEQYNSVINELRKLKKKYEYVKKKLFELQLQTTKAQQLTPTSSSSSSSSSSNSTTTTIQQPSSKRPRTKTSATSTNPIPGSEQEDPLTLSHIPAPSPAPKQKMPQLQLPRISSLGESSLLRALGGDDEDDDAFPVGIRKRKRPETSLAAIHPDSPPRGADHVISDEDSSLSSSDDQPSPHSDEERNLDPFDMISGLR